MSSSSSSSDDDDNDDIVHKNNISLNKIIVEPLSQLGVSISHLPSQGKLSFLPEDVFNFQINILKVCLCII